MTKADIARQYIEKYIDLAKKNKRGYSKRFIAKVIYNENPSIFKDEEEARWHIRAVTGGAGKDQIRKNTADLIERFALIEDPAVELINPLPFIIPQSYKKALIIADLHSRFYDKVALNIAINDGIKHNCDCVIIDGDYMDFYQMSRFDKTTSVIEQFHNEREWGIDTLEMLQGAFGKVFLKKGNHDIRREKKLQDFEALFPEIADLTTYDNYLFYEGSNTEIIEDYRYIIFGKLNIIHGHEFQGGGGIHAAWNRLNKAFDNILSAHSHKAQSVVKKALNGDLYGSWSLGCLCSLNPRYNPINDWSQGYAIVEKDESGDFSVENRVIHKGKSYII